MADGQAAWTNMLDDKVCYWSIHTLQSKQICTDYTNL